MSRSCPSLLNRDDKKTQRITQRISNMSQRIAEVLVRDVSFMFTCAVRQQSSGIVDSYTYLDISD